MLNLTHLFLYASLQLGRIKLNHLWTSKFKSKLQTREGTDNQILERLKNPPSFRKPREVLLRGLFVCRIRSLFHETTDCT